MLKVKDVMTHTVVTVKPNTEITKASTLLIEKGINGVPVLDEQDQLVGILCQSDLVGQQKRLPLPPYLAILDSFIPLFSKKRFKKEVDKISATMVKQIMTPSPVTVTSDTSVEKAASIMIDNHFHTLPVVDEKELVGIVGKEDILRTLI
jgi:CBS domain-containing protein